MADITKRHENLYHCLGRQCEGDYPYFSLGGEWNKDMEVAQDLALVISPQACRHSR
jgi:hypothetical protein